LAATVGVKHPPANLNPRRDWARVTQPRDWKDRLRDYFRHEIPAHEWFEPWRIGLALLGVSYEEGTAAHLDSYRSTTSMLTKPVT
jgi:hypothetical protein